MAAAHILVGGPTVLLVSREDDRFPARQRRKHFERAGYRVTEAYSLGQGISIALRIYPDLVILGESFSDHEQVAFVECLHESHPDIYVLRLGPETISTEDVVSGCRVVMSGHPGGRRVHALRPAEHEQDFDWT